jgi:hypothetical protein
LRDKNVIIELLFFKKKKEKEKEKEIIALIAIVKIIS